MDEEEKLIQLRKLLGPALPAFRTAVAARRATGATDEDMEAMLAEIEAGLYALDTMDADQISDMMTIYREEQEAASSPPEGPATVQPSHDSVMSDACRECKQPVVEIDNRGQHLSGCTTCNIWWSAEEEKVRLSEEDLRALHAMRNG
jgi:hypothetical protein